MGSRDPVGTWAKYALAAVMVIGPLFQVVYLVVDPMLVPGKEYLPAIAAHPDGYRAMSWISLVGALTMAPAVIGVGMVAMRGARLLGLIGMALAVPGMLNPDGNPTDVAYVAARAGVPAQTVEDMYGRLSELPASGLFGFYAFGVLFAVGGVLLGVALFVGRSAPRWAAIALILTPVTALVASFVDLPPVVETIGWALATIGFAGCALALIRRDPAAAPANRTP